MKVAGLITAIQIAKELNLPESTVRYYRDRFINYIPSVGEGRNRRYKPEALDVIRTIAEGFKSNLTADQVEERLERLFPRNIETTETNAMESTATQQQVLTPYQSAGMMIALLATQSQLLKQISENLDRTDEHEKIIKNLQNELKELKSEREKSDNKIEQDLLERDKALLEKMKVIMEEREQETKKPWYKRIFG